MVIFAIISALILIIGFFMKSRITTPVILLPLTICLAISLLDNSVLGIVYSIVIAACIIGWIVIKFKFPELNFNKRIISLSLNKNKHHGRIIGTVFPYTKKQLPFNNSTIVQDDIQVNGGMLITGSSGSGKTHTLVNLIRQDIANGKNVCFIDFKGDVQTLKDIKKGFESIKTYTLSFEGVDFMYDPFINLDDTGKVEALLNLRQWSLDGRDAHYKTSLKLFLQKAVSSYHGSGNFVKGFYNALLDYEPTREESDAYYTVIKLLELVMTSEIKSMFDGEGFSFNQDEQFILLVSFTSSTKELGSFLSSLIFRDLLETKTKMQSKPLSLYIDEFASCTDVTSVKDILEKGRSANIGTVISIQDLSQLAVTTNEYYVDSILGTINTALIFAGATRTTAEKLAGIQVYQSIETILMELRKPYNGKPPTAMIISKYPIFRNGGTETYRIIPYNDKINLNNITNIIEPEHKTEEDYVIDFKEETTKPNDEVSAPDFSDLL